MQVWTWGKVKEALFQQLLLRNLLPHPLLSQRNLSFIPFQLCLPLNLLLLLNLLPPPSLALHLVDRLGLVFLQRLLVGSLDCSQCIRVRGPVRLVLLDCLLEGVNIVRVVQLGLERAEGRGQ